MNDDQFLQNSSANLNVDLNAIINNYQKLKSVSSSANCAAVVKADAYGLGMEQVATALYHHTNCTIFFVANINEAIKLRSCLKEAIIYVFNGLFGNQIDHYIDHNIRPILNDLSQIALWQGKSEPCAIHFDTGINRLGLSEKEAEIFLNSQNDLNLSLILSHLVRSDEAHHITNIDQLEKFEKINDALPDIPASLCNSAGIYLGPDYHFDLVRPGIMLYGGNPGTPPLPDGICSTFEIKGKILQIRDLNIGDSVGYNGIWTAKQPSRVAIINVGYADGYLKLNDNVGEVYLDGHIAPVIGKVSMDMIAIDITSRFSGPNFDKVKVEEEVELVGTNITLEMAAQVSTLGQYEFLTTIGQRYYKNYF